MINRNYIHDIKPSARTQKRRNAFHRVHEEHVRELEESLEPHRREYSTRSSSGRGVWYVAVIAIIILVFALTFLFAGATVFVTPRTGTVELSGPIVAEKESRSGLSFEMLVLDDEKSVTVTAEGKQHVEKKATGSVRMFNNNAAAQKLLIDTRLESPDGYIYKTKTPVTIPGQKTEGGKKVAGSVDVDIYADAAGEVYNIEQADFKVVGFRGSPKYETIYARSITPIAGGFSGDAYDIPEEDLENHKTALRAELNKSLLEKAMAELPEDFIMYENVSVITFEEPVVEESGTTGQVDIKQHGKISALIFKETDLTKALVEKVITNTEENKVTIPNIRELNIELDKGSVVSDPEEITDIKIVINDKINVVWEVNEEELKEALLGVRKRDFEGRMLQFKNIDRAELNLKPFWKNTLPDKAGAIKIVNTFEEEQ